MNASMAEEEKTPLLEEPSYQQGPMEQFVAAENRLKTYYYKAMSFIRAREFLAEFLATFLLVVRHRLIASGVRVGCCLVDGVLFLGGSSEEGYPGVWLLVLSAASGIP